jgi:hypothetical protein
MYKTTTDELKIEQLRERLGGMADDELLRFGWATKSTCFGESRNGGDPDHLLLQLQEARVEWNRRKPALPLHGSF